MRIPFLMLLLALWATVSYANLPDLPSVASNIRNLLSGENTTSNKTTTSPKPTTSSATTTKNPLPYGKEDVAKEIENFAQNLLTHIFNYKRYFCFPPKAFCFPIDTLSMDLPDLLAVKAKFKKLYGTQYESIVHLKNVEDKVWKETAGIREEITKIKTDTFHLWRDILHSLEGKEVITESDMYWLENNNEATIERFVQIFDIEKVREVLGRVRNVFGPALNKTVSSETLTSVKRQFDDSGFPRLLTIQSTSLNDETDIVYIKEKLAKTVEEYVKNIFINLFTMEEWAIDYYIGGFGPFFKFDDFSLRTLIIFDHFIKDTYGDAVSKIPVKPKSSYAEIEERSSITKSIQSMANKMVDLWINNLERIVHGNYSVKAERVKKRYEIESNFVSYFVKLEELRLIHRKALAVFGGAFDAINSDAVKSEQPRKLKNTRPLEFDSTNVETEITRKQVDSVETEFSDEVARDSINFHTQETYDELNKDVQTANGLQHNWL